MTESQQPVSVLIAAGGAAGHVLPALAVAEELQARGARVTFAGSPDRLEARLVPEAGYVFHPYRVAGLPRRPGMELVRALMTDARAVRAAGRIVDSERPDVVLGGGGYVAGPVVAAGGRGGPPPAGVGAGGHPGGAEPPPAPPARPGLLSVSHHRPAAPEEPPPRRPSPRR